MGDYYANAWTEFKDSDHAAAIKSVIQDASKDTIENAVIRGRVSKIGRQLSGADREKLLNVINHILKRRG